MQQNTKILATLKLINKYFWKTKIAPILSLGIPLGFMLLFFALEQSNDVNNGIPSTSFISGLPSFISLSIFPFMLMTLPQMHTDFKNSILLRKIRISNIGKYNYFLLIFGYSTVMSLFFTLITFLAFLAFGNESLFEVLPKSIDAPTNISGISLIQSIDWLGLIYGIIMLIISGVPLGLFIGIISKSPMVAQLIGLTIFMLSLTLSGQFIPLSVIAQITGLEYVILFSPLNYALSLINSATIPLIKFVSNDALPPEIMSFEIFKNNIFDLTTPFKINDLRGMGDITLFATWHKGLNLFFPLLVSGSFITLDSYFFKWSSR